MAFNGHWPPRLLRSSSPAFHGTAFEFPGCRGTTLDLWGPTDPGRRIPADLPGERSQRSLPVPLVQFYWASGFTSGAPGFNYYHVGEELNEKMYPKLLCGLGFLWRAFIKCELSSLSF